MVKMEIMFDTMVQPVLQCRVFDCRAAGQYKQWVAGAGCEVERVAWDHFSPHRVLASTDQGQVVCVDVR